MTSDFEKHSQCSHRTAPRTVEDIQEKLRSYVKVDRERYDCLEFNSHVRYFKSNGDFKCGGFVYINPKVTTEGRKYMLLKSDKFRTKGAVVWTLYYDDINKLYTKTGSDYQMVLELLNKRDEENRENLNKIATHLRKLYTKIRKLEDNTDGASVTSCVSDFMKHKRATDNDSVGR